MVIQKGPFMGTYFLSYPFHICMREYDSYLAYSPSHEDYCLIISAATVLECGSSEDEKNMPINNKKITSFRRNAICWPRKTIFLPVFNNQGREWLKTVHSSNAHLASAYHWHCTIFARVLQDFLSPCSGKRYINLKRNQRQINPTRVPCRRAALNTSFKKAQLAFSNGFLSVTISRHS